MQLPPVLVICLMTIGWIAGSFAHEIGHFVVAAALGLHPRLLKVGRGRSLVHFSIGKARVHILELPLGGRVELLPRLRRRRFSHIAFALGGVAGNAVLFTLIAAVSAMDDRLSRWLLPPGLIQLLTILLNLAPIKYNGKTGLQGTDGWLVFHYLFGRFEPAIPALHKAYIQGRLSVDVEVPPISACTADIIYYIQRQNRLTQGWARRDATAALRQIIAQKQLAPAERAALLDFLVECEMLGADTGVSDAELDAWSLEAVTLFDLPPLRVSRGTTLAALGRAAEAQAVLQAVLEEKLDPYNAAFAELALASVNRALGNEGAARSGAEQARSTAETSPAMVPRMARLQHMLSRNGPAWRLEAA